ncbi:hypothetical protein [Streptomyces sp. NPDC005533]|uniref:hypothetical protein n=1 Tax=Streptomyces sp. NPDC005533 TaxID=3364723 RepID=UPI0036B46AAE
MAKLIADQTSRRTLMFLYAFNILQGTREGESGDRHFMCETGTRRVAPSARSGE